MKRAGMVLGAALAAWLPAAPAQVPGPGDAGWYLGTGLTPARARPEMPVPPHLGEAREIADPGVQQFGGYRFTSNLGVELGYAGGSQSTAWTVAGTGLLPVSRSFSLSGRFGLALPAAEYSLTSAAGALSSLGSMDSARYRNNLLWGFGGQYDLNQSFGLRMDYNGRYGEDPAANRVRTDLWSINAVVRF